MSRMSQVLYKMWDVLMRVDKVLALMRFILWWGR